MHCIISLFNSMDLHANGFVRDNISLQHAKALRSVTEKGLIRVQYVKSSKNIADILTKVLPAQQVRFLMHLMSFSKSSLCDS